MSAPIWELARNGQATLSSVRQAWGHAEIEQDVASDPDEAGMVVDWQNVSVELPKPKADLHMRIDRDVLDWFKRQGKGYQTRINEVLRSYVARMRHQ